MGLKFTKKMKELRHIWETKLKPEQDAYWNSLTEEEKGKVMEANMEIFYEFEPYRQAVNEEFL